MVVVYNGNDPTDVPRVQSWLHRKLDGIQLHGGTANWSDWQTSLNWMAGLFKAAPIRIFWSVPLIPTGATLAIAGAGGYNDKYTALAHQFVQNYGTTDKIPIRLGWEFNGDGWNPWSAVGKAQDYINAYRAFVTAFRQVSGNFVFEWTPNIGDVGMNPEDAYPGDSYVDWIGMDFYYDLQWESSDPVQAWNFFVSEKYGLQWHQNFAAAHHKPTDYAEWGVNSNTAGPFIKSAAQWFNDYSVIYQSYWNSNGAFTGSLSDNQYPAVAAAYLAAFSSQPPVTGIPGSAPACATVVNPE
jgi:hypothetical protein